MEMIFHAHSGLRYLVLLAGGVATIWFAWGWLAGKRYRGVATIVMRSFVGLLDLQILLGLILLFAGWRPPGIGGHAVLMVIAAVAAHLASAANRRSEEPGYSAPLVGVLLSMALVVGGILAIRDAVF